ncbi:DUF6096 family protein [Hominifimenecus sp. rT4P-3]|uniref:DUF6096 family protein n=1 Tax=Hominifimenecus sp. rT4P-3 TaxID=3242979 RepID=UPI003DA6827C
MEFGIDEVQEEERQEDIIDIKKAKKAFAYWSVGDKEHKLKLTTEQTCRLEEKFKGNLMNLLMGGNIPALGVMLTVIQMAMSPWEHSIKYRDVQRMFDQYVAEGGTHLTLMVDVIIPLMSVSGFFTENQKEEMEERVEEMKETM